MRNTRISFLALTGSYLILCLGCLLLSSPPAFSIEEDHPVVTLQSSLIDANRYFVSWTVSELDTVQWCTLERNLSTTSFTCPEDHSLIVEGGNDGSWRLTVRATRPDGSAWGEAWIGREPNLTPPPPGGTCCTPPPGTVPCTPMTPEHCPVPVPVTPVSPAPTTTPPVVTTPLPKQGIFTIGRVRASFSRTGKYLLPAYCGEFNADMTRTSICTGYLRVWERRKQRNGKPFGRLIDSGRLVARRKTNGVIRKRGTRYFKEFSRRYRKTRRVPVAVIVTNPNGSSVQRNGYITLPRRTTGGVRMPISSK